jgi:predicted TIM-barrel fold metal-dependent hydrolase
MQILQVAEYTSAYPERFVGIGGVNLAAPMEAAQEAERCVRDYGFKGIQVIPWLWNLPPNANVYYPLLAKLSELGAAFRTLVSPSIIH